MRNPPKALVSAGTATDDRYGGASFARKAMRAGIPGQWTFLLGEIAMSCFFVLLLTGSSRPSSSARARGRRCIRGLTSRYAE